MGQYLSKSVANAKETNCNEVIQVNDLKQDVEPARCGFCGRRDINEGSVSNTLCNTCYISSRDGVEKVKKEYLALLQNVTDHHRILLSAFLRKYNKNYNIFPQDVIKLILRWLILFEDFFDKESVGYHTKNVIKLTNENQMVELIKTNDDDTRKKYCYIFGKKVIKYGESMIWRIKINKLEFDTAYIIFGIIETDKVGIVQNLNCHLSDAENGGYGYVLCTKYYMTAHKKNIQQITFAINDEIFKTNDIITMKLELNQNDIRSFGSLKYFIERDGEIINSSYGRYRYNPSIIRFDNIDPHKSYKMVLGMCANNKIELL